MKNSRPNFLFIFTDQQRWDFVGYAGADFLDTPNLDKLAGRGMQFSQTFTNCPICAPARIALATGQAPFRVAPQSNFSFLPTGRPTYYQRLRDSGYHVGAVGKLDLAKASGGRISLRGDRPLTYQWGFTHPMELEGKWNSGCSEVPIGPYSLELEKRGLLRDFHQDYRKRTRTGYPGNCWNSILPEELFQDTYTAARAVNWIEDADEDYPWHLFVSFAGPHDPFDPPARLAEKYRHRPMPPRVPPDRTGKPSWQDHLSWPGNSCSEADVETARRQYCAAIEAIDEGIGRILAAAEQRGMLDNTIVVFSSDHGESLGDHGLWEKQVPYEGSIHIPLLVAGPGIHQGRCDEIVELIDLAPTICELANAGWFENTDARSFAHILRNGTGSHRQNALITMPNFSCVRTHGFKFIHNVNADCELYDLTADPGERFNVAPDQPGICAEMGTLLRERLMEGGGR